MEAFSDQMPEIITDHPLPLPHLPSTLEKGVKNKARVTRRKTLARRRLILSPKSMAALLNQLKEILGL